METKIYLHGEGMKSIKSLSLNGIKTKKDLISKFKEQSALEFDDRKDEIEVFLDKDLEEKLNGNVDRVIRDKDHIHCHRCKKVEATVVYNSDNFNTKLPPNVKLQVILKRALAHFKIGPKDGADLVLRLTEQGEILQDYDRLGSFAKFPDCEVKFFLTPKRNVQG